MKIQNTGFLSIEQLQDTYLNSGKNAVPAKTQEGLSFLDVLQNTRQYGQEGVRFSKHAAGRLADRNIQLTQGQMERLKEGTVRAQEKGIKESLVLVDKLAFIVNIPNNTVVTAMEQSDAAENIFTNIDGAVII